MKPHSLSSLNKGSAPARWICSLSQEMALCFSPITWNIIVLTLPFSPLILKSWVKFLGPQKVFPWASLPHWTPNPTSVPPHFDIIDTTALQLILFSCFLWLLNFDTVRQYAIKIWLHSYISPIAHSNVLDRKKKELLKSLVSVLY